jgi:uncharacterized caspase-like protein
LEQATFAEAPLGDAAATITTVLPGGSSIGRTESGNPKGLPMRSRLLVATLAVILLAVPCLTAHAATRVALVIGISGYRHAPALKNPANDAKGMSAILRELGFAVTEAVDLDKRGLDEAIRTFAHGIAGADAALVFFAGHGLQVAGQNYLLPIDAKIESERDLDFETVRLEFILRQLESGRDGKVSIVMLDACRDNPLARNLARSMGVRSEAFPRGLAPVQSGAGMFIAFSTQPGNVAYDGQGRNSPFAGALLRHIRATGKSLNALMIDVRKDVIAATRGRQVPWEHSALTDEFQFQPSGGLTTGSIPSSTPLTGEDARREERARRLDEELGRRPATTGGN